MKNHKKYYSYSMLNTFSHCPQKYKLIYIDRIRKKEESIEAFLGKVVHQVLEWLYSSKNIKRTIMLDEIISKYKEIWLNRWHGDIMVYAKQNTSVKANSIKGKVYKEGIDCLVNYWNRYGPKFYEVDKQNELAIENMELEKKYTSKIAGYNFIGIVDRMSFDNDVITITDYKTTKRSKTERQAKTDLQMGIYYKLIKENLNVKKIFLCLIYLRGLKQIDFEISSKDYNKIENKIKNLMDKILLEEEKFNRNKNDQELYKPNEGFLCNWCYYWQECDIKKTDNPSLKVI